MAFQFLCPQGHLLEADEAQVGQKCRCPYCESEFLVPQPVAPGPSEPPAEPDQPSSAAAGGQPAVVENAPGPGEHGGEVFPGIDTGGRSPAEGPVPVGPQAPTQQDVLHIICPNGHELETPREMLGQDAMCPFCQAQFRLRLEDSREYRQERAEEQQRREQKLGKAWMNWAIAAAVVVVLGVIMLVAIAVGS